MPNSNPQAVRVANEKLRPLADKLGQLYNLIKALAAEASAENWTALFPNDATVIDDGADVDGRAPVTNAEMATLIGVGSAYLTFMEQNSNANRNVVLKIAVNPERF